MSASAQRVRPGGKLRSIGFGGPGCSCWRRRWRHHRARPGRDAIPRMPTPLRSARRGWRSTSHAPPLLDTHAWFWWLDGSGPLTRKVRTTLDAYPDTQRPALCAISLWEVALLVELGRVRLRQGFDEWIEVAAATETVRLFDVTPAVAKELLHLPRSFHRDPVDRLIVATARALDLAVLTDDGPIRRSGLVRLWRP